MENTTMCALMQQTISDHGDSVALRDAGNKSVLTWREYGERVEAVARGLAARGIERGDTVALMLTNRPEFHMVDAAVMHLGAIPFSVYNTSSTEQISYLFANAGNRLVVCEEQFLSTVRAAAEGSSVEAIVCVDIDAAAAAAGKDAGPVVLSLAALETSGTDDFDFHGAWSSVSPQDVLTLIYTSGTTGPPKGVELTHANLIYVLRQLPVVLAESTGGRVISYLPDAHIVNRFSAHYAPMMFHTTTVTLNEPKRLLEVLQQVRPTEFVGVPMLWYRFIGSIQAGLDQQSGVKGALARWALRTGTARARATSLGRGTPLRARLPELLADRLVLARIRGQIGLDQAVSVVTGSAPLDQDAMVFLYALGLPISEAWGMSETTGVTTLNTASKPRLGTVGTPLPGTEIQVAEDGEILVRTPALMKGYRGDPARTSETIDSDGWIHTGDVGSVDADGYVTIVDRKKELIINASGKNMSPANIENILQTACPLVAAAVAIGDRRPHVSALLVLDAEAAKAFADQRGLADTSVAALAASPEVKAAVQQGVDAANARLSRVEHIRSWTILPHAWEPGGDELTPTLKLKRRSIIAKYAAEIEGLYKAGA
ncbi:AMP-dependent synthetase/ligase [Streptomyces sp. NPDC060223]|uniref:AMP-dependent synthetase/ligase n=1 Tax=unclassified Streptomyces TaxID=2593676 RepID=UPI00363C8DFA